MTDLPTSLPLRCSKHQYLGLLYSLTLTIYYKNCSVSLYPDDTYLYVEVRSHEDNLIFQSNMHTMHLSVVLENIVA